MLVETEPSGLGLRPALVLKFRRGLHVGFKDNAETELLKLNVGDWDRVQELAPGSTLRPSLWDQEIRLDDLKKLIERALKEDPKCEADRLLSYFILYCPSRPNLPALLEEIRSWAPDVEDAYVPLKASDPVNSADDTFALGQGYLNAAPQGVDARDAWLHPGGDGHGQEVVDLEQGWKLDHVDLVAQFPSPAAALVYGSNLPGSVAHGTMTLGVICGVDNNLGIIGIAPNLSQAKVASYSGNPTNVPKAIIISTLHLLHFMQFPNLRTGGVLVLEVQLANPGGLITWLPCEADPLSRLCILFASVLGVVVIEAAGNGAGDLDGYVNSAGLHIFDRNLPSEFLESRAIMVGGGRFPPSGGSVLTRRSDSNIGSRIDCHAWAETVLTTTYTVAGGMTTLYDNYNGTSSATAIIAGVALSVQGMAEAKFKVPFAPLQVREFLSELPSAANPNSNTLPVGGLGEKIGVMPNLKAIRLAHIV